MSAAVFMGVRQEEDDFFRAQSICLRSVSALKKSRNLFGDIDFS